MYFIVVGAGNIGRPLIDMATDEGHEVVVIERDAAKAGAISEDFDCMVLQADATVKETLVEAGAHEADAVICTTDHDPTNIMVCLLAQELDVPGLVSVVQREEDIHVFRQIGVSAVENPDRLIAEYLFRAVSLPTVQDQMRVGEHAEIFEVEVADSAPIAGMTLQQAADDSILSDSVLVVAIDRGAEGQSVVPRGQTEIRAGDHVVVYAAGTDNAELLDAFQPPRD